MSFDGKVAIITGAGGGLGKEHALLLADLGVKIVVNDLGGAVDGSGKSDAADLVVEEIRAAGGEAVANKDSVSDREGAKRIVETAVKEYGSVDILINNAGILRDKSFKKMTLDEWDLVINVHLNGSAYVTWHAWPIMYEKNYGRIVFTSSVSGILGSFGQANYGAAKMGMVGLMNNLCREGASHNIHVNCLSPGAATRMTASVPGSEIDADEPDEKSHPKLVSPAVLYMVSEDAPNGRIIQAAGGRFASDMVFSNKGVELDLDATWEDVAENSDTILDVDSASWKTTFWKD
ncbi:MAG: SDR family NAD(P)-dependent oxidoreductase [Gammaproteobacteria bacterium]|jgi:NAD(P)-dependent dehydrogenase (short-subunit alcohol dehydrogenase family)|nr:SDR family NAD(P)-dependent oxidoreductase [Gammaproteobacteria bacterium]MBT5197473.1 SDR family NAD(P)-dependent oxidoreductase [Gammaproteobacteria bacterium]MBT5792111.1 SDR family NAD(P)-dependent oxidoreductase [Gammaproteobacteria bacterium]MBT6571596.1 SDR family NAD(P)-dependent oxidoreductase [Gammaproteobacteria bacterium]MBT6665362.1 SDR family NAD(P)-dependent oxidoreductase [Gammaproteobacteria bacterium]